jgi:integrase
MAKIGKLSAVKIAKTKGPAILHDGGGLYLRVSATGAKSWVLRYQLDGKRHDMGIGPLSLYSLAEARQKALDQRKLRHKGTDPLENRRAQRASQKLLEASAMSFRQCAERYIASHKAGWRNPKHAAQWPATLQAYVYPIFGDLPVQSIDVGLVMKAVEPIWSTKPETASRIRGRIESVLDWAKARGYREGENPARWRGHLANLLPKTSKIRRVVHHAALPYTELPAFIVALREQSGISARALEFAILTATRTGEALGARWGEINLDARLWVVPAERMKAGKEHRVPLSDAAMAVLDEMREHRHDEFVFPALRAGRQLSNMAMLMLLRRMGRDDITAHGFRSAFSDWVAEKTNFPAEVREMALAHSVGDKVEAAYRRGDLFEKRRQLSEAWASFATATPGDNVVQIAAAR